MTGQHYWQDLALEGAKEESGGGAVIAKGRVDMGFFAFVSGFSGDDREKCVFIPKVQSKKGRTAAGDAARKLCTDNGAETKAARWCAITRIYQDEAMLASGKEPEWNGDRLEPTPLWTMNKPEPCAAKLVTAALDEHDVPTGKDFYARFGWPADPYFTAMGEDGRTHEYEGEMRFPTVCVVQEVYANKKVATEAVGTLDTASSDHTWAGDWTEDDLAEMVTTFTAEKANYDDFATLVEDEASEDLVWGVKLLSEIGEMDVADIVKFTGLKKGAVRKALK